MYNSSQLKWHERAWFAASIILNVLSLSSLIDHALGWSSPISLALARYRGFIDAILATTGLVPKDTPLALVSIAGQILVFMGGIFAAANFYAMKTEGQSVYERIYDTSCRSHRFPNLCALRKTTVFYLSGPILLPYVIWQARHKSAPTQRVLGFTFRPVSVAAYYLALFAVIGSTLAVAGVYFSKT